MERQLLPDRLPNPTNPTIAVSDYFVAERSQAVEQCACGAFLERKASFRGTRLAKIDATECRLAASGVASLRSPRSSDLLEYRL